MSRNDLQFSTAADEYFHDWAGAGAGRQLSSAVLDGICRTAKQYARNRGHASIHVADIQHAMAMHRVFTLTDGHQYRELPYTVAEQEAHRRAWAATSPHS